MPTNNVASLMMIWAIIVVLCLMTAGEARGNYCDAKLCDQNEKHIGCKNDGSFAGKCSKGAKLLDINAASQKILVDEHNAVRQQWASGKGKLQVNACRMATISWNSELARLAELNVKQCKMEHDACHNTKQFRYSGQNLYIVFYSGMGAPDVNTILRNAAKSWASEGKDVKREHLSAYPDNYRGPDIGHFTVMAHERNVAVGCAISNYEERGSNTFLVACNYAATNMIDWPVFKTCGKAAEKCTTGANPKHSALCSSSEDIDYNFRKK